MTNSPALDSAGRRRSPATMPGYHAGRPPRNKGMHYPADPPTVEEIVAVMRRAPDDRHCRRLRAIIVVLWRGGLRVQEALALNEHDLDVRRGSLLVRCGKGGRRREVGMDAWGWEHLRPWLTDRIELPVGPLFCVIDGPTRGPPRHRHRGDHRHRPRQTRTDDVRHRGAPALNSRSRRERRPSLPPRRPRCLGPGSKIAPGGASGRAACPGCGNHGPSKLAAGEGRAANDRSRRLRLSAGGRYGRQR
ncbi:MAG: integrase/recombinase XerD [Thermoleophilaceae bacterium]|nr:integrase/recombinase XerD [Thermoleophilaceae bacterium]